LGLSAADLADVEQPHPDALAWAMSLWSERLVGGRAQENNDPPAVAVLASYDGSSLRRLLTLIGMAKLAYGHDSNPPALDRARDRARVDQLRRALEPTEPRLVTVALRDVGANTRDSLPDFPQLGLVTIGRLLAVVEQHRVRWALQRLPYNVAKTVRAKISLDVPGVGRRELLTWEDRILSVARTRLDDEPSGQGPGDRS
jgi:hypothetical protein